MRNDSRSLARLFSLQAMVNDQVLRGTRDPREVADVLQVIIDDPEYTRHFFPPQPVQTEPFRIIEELDLEVDFSLTPDEVLRACTRERYHSGWTYSGVKPQPGARKVHLVIGQAGHDIHEFGQLKPHTDALGLSESGAWVALAYTRLRPKWNKSQPVWLVFPCDEASVWTTVRTVFGSEEIEPYHVVTVSCQRKGPWNNVPELFHTLSGFPKQAYALIRKEI